ncbi:MULTISPECIES: hypothetical protein [Streptomyces]|uniref:Secreted protein n=1 Tax=Streptomyces acidicola TaxID=2596892 RepID=A0A5N8WUE7_9ACTN|nr:MULTISPECIES: hypothetical protein [Streptomyces]MBA2807411.1 hypothetical protein [Streptomyces sp. KM273126]MPY50887.1 hypothetical protein [Streptomyces acidicola]
MRTVQKIAGVAVATCGILLAGIGGASAAPSGGGDNIPVLSNIQTLNWDDSPFCGIQVKTQHSQQKTSCPVVHNEGSTNSPVYIVTFGD